MHRIHWQTLSGENQVSVFHRPQPETQWAAASLGSAALIKLQIINSESVCGERWQQDRINVVAARLNKPNKGSYLIKTSSSADPALWI